MLLLAAAGNAQKTQILWLGNSFTYTNNLPAMFQSLALSGGDTVTFDSYAPGGYTLMQHAQDTNDLHKINSAKWDYVIIQAQSQEPSFPNGQVASQTLPYAHVLDSLVLANDSCTKVVYYMTWGKKYGDAGNCSSYPVICTFDGITQRLRESYLEMGNANHALVSPVGMAWYASWHTDSLINLWASDNNHPNIVGSYLAACVFYGTIFRKSPVGLAYNPLGNADTATFMQNTAYHTVFDSLSTWNIGVFDPHAAFSSTGNDTTRIYSFNSAGSVNYSSVVWYFGDGDSSFVANPSHLYADSGTYKVTLIVSDYCGHSDTVAQNITLHHVTIETSFETLREVDTRIYPNPATDGFTVQMPGTAERAVLTAYDVCGKLMFNQVMVAGNNNIDIKNLPAGVYCLLINTGQQVISRKLVKL